MTPPHRRDVPDLDALVKAHGVEQRALNETIVVGAAESVVATARVSELTGLQQAAYRRLSAARGLLTRAQKTGDAAKITAAQERVERAYAEFTHIADEGIDEALQINGARLDALGQTLGQIRRTWDASSAVIDAAAGRRGPQ